MKKIIIALTLPCIMLSTSCSKFVDGYEVSPNNPIKATGPLVLSSAELGLMSVYAGTPARTAGILTQQLGGTADQMLAIDMYDIKEGDATNDWNNIYNNVIQPCNDIVAQYSEGNPHNKGIALVVKAMGLAVATDLWGDVPGQEGGMGNITGNFSPKYDAQKDIYTQIQSLLDEAIVLLKTTGQDVREVGTNDLFFKGDTNKWLNTAYLLKARYAIHLTKKNANDAATKALDALNNVTNAGDLRATYGESTNEFNQWYQFSLDRAPLLRMGANLINMMKASNDPRLSVYAAVAAGGGYVGAAPGSENQNASELGTYMAGQTAPITLAGYVEALFIKAEANFLLGKAQEAADAYNTAVLTHVQNATGSPAPDAFKTAYASETAASITKEKIMNQKYVALFAQIETYTDWRRTGFPTLTPNPSNVLNKPAIPRRLPTDQNERLYNKNVVVTSDILKPVWWDE
ncbi:SusD/RagB family nutrient-binding outer membrane lipoprotein [Chitinophaga varians]|uniref:SusD/RagB family nutrient-binding outer membrane lipoprotein n=1 Tax=Chitinophaga varians TaxID=2202339 RepID=UPI00165F5E9D|nr:SusD/RagB family nutrient-binding outer membrane lipoprotein [Chitinophaga varians]MBC9911267.1 SusD/RagB family nutrient-binding outer membrane lipoprotein [Chitinophaga varians]